jgi:non-specific serine/threonine protein kinase
MSAGGLPSVYASGECEIDLGRRELRVLGAPVPVGGRAFAILEILAQSAGRLVDKNDLMDRIWPGAIVNDNTLQVHISALRKGLGSRRTMLKTESGRGYRLLGDWNVRDPGPAAPAVFATQQRQRSPAEASATNLPATATELIGRSAGVQRLRDLLSAHRLVTLTGAGGIGKSTLALHTARDLLPEYVDGGWLVELASLSDPGLVPSAVTGVLRLNLGAGEISAAAIARAINDRNLLLLLDNCEHVIDAAADLAETFLQVCPRITILATSREVLRIAGEYVYRVLPLDVPSEDEEGVALLECSAVELFITRTKEADSDFAPRVDELAAVAAVCRHLDGIPLAIEFAAARAATFGIRQVAAGLENRFAQLISRRRTALPRHRTLRATLDWSYGLLSAAERQLLRRLAVFSGGFTLAAAASLMRDADQDLTAVMAGISDLVDKSLITPEGGAPLSRWRLLETTRAYAIEKLAESGELEDVVHRHAEFCLDLLAPFTSEGTLRGAIDDLDRYRREIDNLRAALNWAFAAGGDTALGVAIAAAAVDFWGAMSLLTEACEWASKALAAIGDAAGIRHEMVLQCSLGMALIYTQGMIAAAREALMRSLALARNLGDFDYQQRATHDLWLFWARAGASNDALAIALQYEEAARLRDQQSQAIADWIVGIPQTYLAAHVEASERLQRAIDTYPIERRGLDLVRYGADLRASASSHLTVNLLSRGLLDAASRGAMRAIEEARAANQAVVLCIALSWAAGFIFLSLGEWDRARRYGDELVDHAYRHALHPFHATGLCIRGTLAARHGNAAAGIGLLRAGLAEMSEASYLLFYPFFQAELATVLGANGRIDDGLSEIDEALRVAMRIDYRWFVPEILRTKGELLALRGADAPAIEDCLAAAARMAREQEALFWELRVALCLARLRVRSNDREGAARVLHPVYDRFTEGFATPDLTASKALLDQLPALASRLE